MLLALYKIINLYSITLHEDDYNNNKNKVKQVNFLIVHVLKTKYLVLKHLLLLLKKIVYSLY